MPNWTIQAVDHKGEITSVKLKPKQHFISVTQGMSGWFAVEIWLNPKGFLESCNTGAGRYATRQEAYKEAKDWAFTEGIPLEHHKE